MVSLFGSSKDKEKKKEAKEKKKAEEDKKNSTSSLEQPLPPEQVATDGDTSAVNTDTPSAAANDVGTTSASGQVAESLSSESSAHERKEGPLRYGSSYENGVDGRCATCGLVKIACNCQHCHCCRRFLLTLSSRKHCRRCWRATCPKCASFERTNEFLTGERSRTCKECAVPRALVYMTELAYSDYETIGATQDSDADKKSGEAQHTDNAADPTPADDELTVKAAAAEEGEHGAEEAPAAAEGGEEAPAENVSKAQPPDTQPLDMRPFRWGLYALGSEMHAPRRCINPSCPVPISYDHTCHKCKLPTVTLAFHQSRHVDVLDSADTAGSPSGSKTTPALTTAEAIEEAVKAEYDAVAATRTTIEEDEIFAAALPNDMEGSLFASLDGDTWASRKVLMSLVAAAIAGESYAMPNISLAMTQLPAYAKLLRPVQACEAFSVFNAPGHVHFIAFSSGASHRSSIHQVLGTTMSVREAWSSHAMALQKSVAKLVSSAAVARSSGLTDCVAKVMVRDGVLAYVNENDILRTLPDVVDRMAKEGVDVVLCGHGIGGAVASYVAATLLLEKTADLKDRLMCVTFGAPLVGDQALTDLLTRSGLHRNFQHFVNASDMVPRMSYIDDLLASGNTNGTATLVGHGEGMATPAEVREAVVQWTGKHEEPRGAPVVRAHGGKEGFSIAAFARRMRSSKSESKEKQAEAAKAASVTEDSAGDLFKNSREPFDNNIIRAVDEAEAPTLHDADFARFATAAHREKQVMDPCGCYHFLWHPRGKYMCTDDPATAIGLLSDRTDLRVELQDHLLSSYNKAMVEYIYSVSAEE